MMVESDLHVGEKDDHTNTFAYQSNHSINNYNNNHSAAYQQNRDVDMDYLDGLNSALLGNVDDGSPPGPWIHNFLGESFFNQLDDELFQFV
jgi:hypothetical protein